MTDVRSELLSVLARLSEEVPDFRLGQLVVGLSWSARDFTNDAIYEIEDEELLEAARGLLINRRETSGVPPSPTASGPGSMTTVPPDDRSTTTAR